MAQKPHRICQKFKDRNGEDRWNQIGVAFSGDKGMSLMFNARTMIIPGDGIMVFPPREDDGGRTSGGHGADSYVPPEDEDEVGF